MVFCNVFCSAEAARVVEVLQGGERAADDPLCGVDYPLKLLPICIGAAGIPDCNGVGQQTFHSKAVEDHQQLLPQVVPPQHPQEVKTLLCLRNDHCVVCSPCEISRDDGTEEFECLDSLYTVSIEVEGGRVRPVLPEVQDDSFVLVVFSARFLAEHHAVSFRISSQ